MNDKRHDENIEKMIAQHDENVEMVIILEMKRVSVMEDGGCAWMVLNVPPTPPMTAIVISVAVEGCVSPPSVPSFAASKQQFACPE